jgi:hypothetical protein
MKRSCQRHQRHTQGFETPTRRTISTVPHHSAVVRISVPAGQDALMPAVGWRRKSHQIARFTLPTSNGFWGQLVLDKDAPDKGRIGAWKVLT